MKLFKLRNAPDEVRGVRYNKHQDEKETVDKVLWDQIN